MNRQYLSCTPANYGIKSISIYVAMIPMVEIKNLVYAENPHVHADESNFCVSLYFVEENIPLNNVSLQLSFSLLIFSHQRPT